MRLRLALFCLLCLCASSPPAGFGHVPFLGLLALPGWMAFYAMEQDSRRPWLQAWLVGALHMLVLSTSLLSFFAFIVPAIALVAGLYYPLTTAWTQSLRRFVPGPIAFGVGLAACSWLRANMWQIEYPHGQPAHAMYLWPEALGCVRWGGESLANFLMGMLAGSCVDFYRAWRVGRPEWRRSVLVLAGALLLPGLLTLWPWPVITKGATVDVVVIEPRLAAARLKELNTEDTDYFAFIRQLVMPTTNRVAGRGVSGAPRLVVWPESIRLHGLHKDLNVPNAPPEPRLLWHDERPVYLARGCRLLAGASNEEWRHRPEAERQWQLERYWATAVLTDATGKYVTRYEKRHLVPGGENQPWYFRGWLVPLVEMAMGPLPEVAPGRPEFQQPMELENGLKFGPMICFDNAFPGVSMAHREKGARFLVVVSNEAWYSGGAELDQMLAMSVFRCLETGLPMIRSTVDGLTCWLDAHGQIRANLGYQPQDREKPAVLRVQVPIGVDRQPPLAWVHRGFPWLWLLTGLVLMPALFRSWGRLMRRLTLRGSHVPPPARTHSGP